MKTADEIDKIKAVVLYVLSRCGGTLDFVSLVKKMYFAQRKYLALYGRPIFNDKFQARERGPVPSFTYKAIYVESLKGTSSPEIREFNEPFTVVPKGSTRIVSSTHLPDMDELARAEVEILDAVIKETEGMSAEELTELSHQDEAWKIAKKRADDDPTDGGMSLVSIARAGGASNAMLDYLRESLNFEHWSKL